MKTKLYQIIFSAVLLASMGAGSSVLAAGTASLSITPQSGSYKVGQTITAGIYLNPGTEKIDMVRLKLSFPAELLEVKSFVVSQAFSYQAGGNSFDNTAGSLSWGAGAAGGITSPSQFGTATFVVKKEGAAQITVLPESLALSAGENKLNGQASIASYTLAKPAPAKPAPSKPSDTGQTPPAVTADTDQQTQPAQITNSNLIETNIGPEAKPQSFTASFLTVSTIKGLAIAGAIVLAILFGFILMKVYKKSNTNS